MCEVERCVNVLEEYICRRELVIALNGYSYLVRGIKRAAKRYRIVSANVNGSICSQGTEVVNLVVGNTA